VVDGEIRDVSEFAHLRPKDRPVALCPQCDRRTILKLGSVRMHHAAHRPQDVCIATAPETALHLNAKFHLARELRRVATIKLREVCQNTECDQVRQREWAVSWDAVEVERCVGTLRPDLTLTRGGVAVAAVEVFATHAVDDEKARALADARLPWVEVRASAVIENEAWTPTQPLPMHKEGPHRPWVCEACERKQAERKKEQAELERLTAARRAAAAKALTNGEFSYCARLVDFYYRTGKHVRDTYEILEEKVDGQVVAVILRSRMGRPTRFPGGLTENRERVRDRFQALMEEFERHGAIVDSPMDWERDVDWFSWMRKAERDRNYPCRYEWDQGTARWSIKPEFDGVRWRGG